MSADYNALNDQFQQLLGRQISPDEFQYLGKFMNEGNLQGHEIGQLVQSLPEYQNNLLNKNTAQFGQQLNAQNQAILGQAGAEANSRFASLGRPNTSAIGASILQAGGQLAQQRQSALADFYGRGLQQNAALGVQQGQNALNRGYGLRDETRQRGYQIEDYYRQQNDFNNYQNAHSGWNAITPEFVASGLFSIGGKAAAAATGGAIKPGQPPQPGYGGGYPSGGASQYGGYA